MKNVYVYAHIVRGRPAAPRAGAMNLRSWYRTARLIIKHYLSIYARYAVQRRRITAGRISADVHHPS